MERKTRLLPSLLLSEIYPPGRRAAGDIPDALAEKAREGYFRHFEIPAIEDLATARRIRQTAQAAGVTLTVWMTETMNAEGLSLAALEEGARTEAVRRAEELLRIASACGALCAGCLSGPDPGEDRRPAARAQLAKSLIELGRLAERESGLRLAIEPLDRGAHKNGLIGPTAEAAELMAAVRARTKSVFIGWDSGHTALNGEDLVASLRRLAPYTCQLHLSNPVLDRKDPRFGDFHYPIGEFGAGTVAEFTRAAAAAAAAEFPIGPAISLAVEVRTQGSATPAQTIAHCQDVLSRVISST